MLPIPTKQDITTSTLSTHLNPVLTFLNFAEEQKGRPQLRHGVHERGPDAHPRQRRHREHDQAGRVPRILLLQQRVREAPAAVGLVLGQEALRSTHATKTKRDIHYYITTIYTYTIMFSVVFKRKRHASGFLVFNVKKDICLEGLKWVQIVAFLRF